jgi:alkylhydroperoxidase family enzyme
MQVSLRIACPFCIDMNSSKFRQFYITDEEIQGMQGLIPIKDIDTFSRKEKLTIYYIRGLVRTPIKHNPEVVSRMTKIFTEKEFATIVTTIAQVDYWTRIIQGFGIQPAGF